MTVENPIFTYLKDNITHIVFTTKYDPPSQTGQYIETLAEDGLELDRVAVTPVVRNENLIISYVMDENTANCDKSDVASGSGKDYTLDDASFLTAGDRVECIDSLGNYIDDRKIISVATNDIELDKIISDLTEVRLKISRGCIIVDGTSTPGTGTPIKWFTYRKYKDSTMSYSCEEVLIRK
jgi:hypothetical protein